MNSSQPEDLRTLLSQTRSLLAVTILLVVLSHSIDPPYSVLSILLDSLVLVVLVFILLRLHRFLKAI